MGKAENIKRAKKLKEAKRKREVEALMAQGLGPAGKVLQQKSKELGVETQLNMSGVKYSDLLKEFVEPTIEKTDGVSDLKTKLAFGILAWNAAIMGEKDEKYILNTKDELSKLTPNNNGIQFKGIIEHFELRKIKGGDYDLTVAYSPTVD
jgi:hypothetical protein